jgi:hypothetical protein
VAWLGAVMTRRRGGALARGGGIGYAYSGGHSPGWRSHDEDRDGSAWRHSIDGEGSNELLWPQEDGRRVSM